MACLNITENFRILRSAEEVGVGSWREYEVDMGHLEDMKIRIWSYNNHPAIGQSSSQQQSWFWRAVRSLDMTLLAELASQFLPPSGL
jgi:hypothetical protein